jgi:hypothetical protein
MELTEGTIILKLWIQGLDDFDPKPLAIMWFYFAITCVLSEMVPDIFQNRTIFCGLIFRPTVDARHMSPKSKGIKSEKIIISRCLSFLKSVNLPKHWDVYTTESKNQHLTAGCLF